MSSDESIRLRLHRRLAELLDSDLADAMMESMPPMRWDQLATKDDVARLDARGDRLERALAESEERLGSVIRVQGERLEALIDGQGQRHTGALTQLEALIDAQGQRHTGELALLEGRLSVRYVETTRMIVFAMMTLFVGVVAVMITTVG
ncbi:MAG: hypothetical protein GY708_05555 [Actinomycetia bacterium]|nr:hypothetical protein [Actinomycetes bacterium]